MRCWINGSLCPYQSGDDFGLLTVSANICNGCIHVLERKGDLIEIVEEIGIKPEPEAPISEEDWDFLTNNAKFLLSGLGLLRKEYSEKSEKVPGVDEKTIQKLIDGDEQVIGIRQFIAAQKSFLVPKQGLDSILKNLTAGTIMQAEKRLESIEKRIREELKSIIDERIEIISELIKLIKKIRELE